ncbi:MAG TPA: glycosyltransferase [Terriglobia bacterium]|nr:glycosyltransferase [Terriglobia bacterium]
MKFVIFGLSISSSWGNGHATLWRGLCRALAQRDHEVVFFERDVPYYAAHRDFCGIEGVRLVLYPGWREVEPLARQELHKAEIGLVTSYCPDGVAAADLLLSSDPELKVFYDLDAPVTIDRWANGGQVTYLSDRGLRDFDLVLSYTGGETLQALQNRLGARRVAPLYGSADPEAHYPVSAESRFQADFSYLGTYAEDRQALLDQFFIQPARRLTSRKFVLGGSLYPENFPWTRNMFYVSHLRPREHPAFYGSSPLTLNVTRGVMRRMGYCPSGRLFEAAACGTAIISDAWPGLEMFFEPGKEILIASRSDDVVTALEAPREQHSRVARAARERFLAAHTAAHRAQELEAILDRAHSDSADLRGEVPVQ